MEGVVGYLGDAVGWRLGNRGYCCRFATSDSGVYSSGVRLVSITHDCLYASWIFIDFFRNCY